MKANEMSLWDVEPFTSLKNESELECPECKEWSKLEEWSEAESYCEGCGSHAAIKCPLCEELLDHVYTGPIKSRP